MAYGEARGIAGRLSLPIDHDIIGENKCPSLNINAQHVVSNLKNSSSETPAYHARNVLQTMS